MANATTIIYCPKCKLHRAINSIKRGDDGRQYFILDCQSDRGTTVLARFHAVPRDEATGMTMEEVM